MREKNADMVQGDRSHARRDNVVRRVGSIVGRKFRKWLLGDTIRDTGCSLRVFKREIALALPLEFKGIHRFIPVSARHLGFTVVEMPVNHRPRLAGETKYGFGITKRALPGLHRGRPAVYYTPWEVPRLDAAAVRVFRSAGVRPVPISRTAYLASAMMDRAAGLRCFCGTLPLP